MDTFPYFPIAADSRHVVARGTRAKLTGEHRPPRKGELYISGAIAEAYVAYNDLSTSYRIAVPVAGHFQWVEDAS